MKATIVIDWDNYTGPGAGVRPPHDLTILNRGEGEADSLKTVQAIVRAAVADAVRGMDPGDSLRVKLDILPRKGGRPE